MQIDGRNDTNDTDKQDALKFSYPKLKKKIKDLEKETKEYTDQVKGPVMDEADLWLQKKKKYEDSTNVLSKGMSVERQLLHKLRVEVKNNGTKKLKEMEENMKAVEDGPNSTNSTNTTNSTK